MKIIKNYDGASIDIIHNDTKNNKVVLSLKKELNNYSHYFNFKVINDLNKDGVICLTNFDKSLYYKENIQYVPYIKVKDKFISNAEDKIKKDGNNYLITIEPNLECEISLYPRYVEDNLNDFILKIKRKNNISIINDIITEIRIGDFNKKVVAIVGRQHPGETLSSFFIEGIIDAIIKNKAKLNEYSFIIFPMLNKVGVKNGNHRYTNGIDYNRAWDNHHNVLEIEFIKQELEKNIPMLFIDVHGDEISCQDYIRTTNIKRGNKILDMLILKDQSKFRRLIRGIIKQRKIINVFKMTAREYISKKYHCEGMLVELSLINREIDEVRKKGYNFILEILGGKKHEKEYHDSCEK